MGKKESASITILAQIEMRTQELYVAAMGMHALMCKVDKGIVLMNKETRDLFNEEMNKMMHIGDQMHPEGKIVINTNIGVQLEVFKTDDVSELRVHLTIPEESVSVKEIIPYDPNNFMSRF